MQPSNVPYLTFGVAAASAWLWFAPELSGALAPSLLREEAQATCYPAGSTGYGRHVDEPDGSRGRVLSARVFVGDGWEAARGGETRLHLAGDAADVASLDGRLLLFWSGRVPHEVRPCSTADRCALSVWYTDAAAAGALRRRGPDEADELEQDREEEQRDAAAEEAAEPHPHRRRPRARRLGPELLLLRRRRPGRRRHLRRAREGAEDPRTARALLAP